ncbi:MAG: Flp family type IVb pilin [Phycisphaerae bacterium]
MNWLKKQVKAFIADDAGTVATEYSVMILLVIVVCLVAVSALGETVSSNFVNVETEWNTYAS